VPRARARTFLELTALAKRLSRDEELLAAQEVGTMCHFVHDIFTSVGIRVQSFNAQHLRVIAASRKKTDKRDDFWIAKSIQTGMTPHPVHVPDATVRKLRSLLAPRLAVANERKGWLLRARSHLRATGVLVRKGATKITRMLEGALMTRDGLPTTIVEAIELLAPVGN
jgi:transposase